MYDHPFLDDLDKRKETVTRQAVFIEIVRRPIGCGDNYDTRIEQRREKPPQYHGVGDIADMEFIETEQPAFGSYIFRDMRQDVVDAIGLQAMQPFVNLKHELMEMHAALVFRR